MIRAITGIAAAAALALVLTGVTASAQKQGGILRTYDPDSPGGLSIQEEAPVFARGPMMGVFNNLIMYDQHVPQNSLLRSCRISRPNGHGTRRGPP